jgi:hypothetical protein
MSKGIDFGFPETIVLSGTWLLCNEQPVFGMILCILGIVAASCRTAIRIQRHQEEIEERKQWYKDLNVAGIGMTNAFVGNYARNKEDDVFH